MPIRSFFIMILISLSCAVSAQVVWENPNHEVINFLNRQAQKGKIYLDDYIQPISRTTIIRLLRELKSSTLSLKEQQELDFYSKDFTELDSLSNKTNLFQKDQYHRFRVLSVKSGDFLLRVDPILTLGTTLSKYQHITAESHGLSLYGEDGKHFSFQASFRDITESGIGLDSLKNFTPETGIIKTENLNPNAKKLNYSDLRGYLSYAWKNGNISIGKDQNLWGYGENGQIVLSAKAPSYPFIRLDYQPLSWLRFNYLHAWLQSGLIDSSASYPKGNNIYGTNRLVYIPKFLASHSLNFIPTKGLVLSLGESMVYSDRLDAAYLIPIMFFKAYDQYKSRYNINSGSNSQFFFQASSRNHIKNTHLYGSLFIDEIRIPEIFNAAKSRNQLGFNIGGSVTDVFFSYLTLGLDYTRINPFVYHNLIPAQTYENQNYVLGDWMGSNADRFITFIKYTPVAKVKTRFQYQKIRKGSEGTLLQQYFAEPQPKFLFDLQKVQTMATFSVSYEWLNNLYLNLNYSTIKDKNYSKSQTDKTNRFEFSIRYGL